MMENWHCSFYDLVNKHTEGQLIILAEGNLEWKNAVEEEVKKLSKSDPERKIHKPPKKFETASEYDAWLKSSGF